MKDMFNKFEVDKIKNRVKTLTQNSTANWGKFEVHNMICHLQDAIKYSLGQTETAIEVLKGPPMFIRRMIGLYMPFPKGKIKTSPMMLKTKPENWDDEIKLLLELLDQLFDSAKNTNWPLHPFFGDLKAEEWARLTYRHVNHHLSQFNV